MNYLIHASLILYLSLQLLLLNHSRYLRLKAWLILIEKLWHLIDRGIKLVKTCRRDH